MKPLLLALLAIALSPVVSAQTALVDDCGTIRIAADASVTLDRARVSEEAARAAALRAFPGTTVTDVDLDEEDGYLVYEVELTQDRTELDVVVDAGTARVLCAERD